MYTQLKGKTAIAHSAQLLYDRTMQNQTYK